MSYEFTVKSQALDAQAQQEVVDFVDFRLEKKGRRKPPYDPEAYRQKLLSISVWSDEDIKPIEDARQHFNTMHVSEW